MSDRQNGSCLPRSAGIAGAPDARTDTTGGGRSAAAAPGWPASRRPCARPEQRAPYPPGQRRPGRPCDRSGRNLLQSSGRFVTGNRPVVLPGRPHVEHGRHAHGRFGVGFGAALRGYQRDHLDRRHLHRWFGGWQKLRAILAPGM
ncbi:hypothetical protein AB0395_31350 [Streptosporangium sp. NPDC051023]|uniref:hypothetical protein n=1 Tax=Streptosporangium sp. NPDC051023 TaxID=3155410 RepID=UPI00344DF0CD